MEEENENIEQILQLLRACEQGNSDSLDSLLSQGLDIDCTNQDDCTPLQVAAANGHESMARALLMRGAGLDKANIHGWTPLMHAARNGHAKVVALLIQNKCDLHAVSCLGSNSLVLACRGGSLETVQTLFEAGIETQFHQNSSVCGSVCEFSPVMVAAQCGHDSIIRYLLDRRFDVNYRTPSMGVNALMLAALSGHLSTTQILVERSANPDLTNSMGKTPLDIAEACNRHEVRGFLERKTTNRPHEDKKPNIFQAAESGDSVRVCEILNLDVGQRDAVSQPDGATPLMYAAMAGHLNVVRNLIEKMCDLDKQDICNGWTALMQGIYHRHYSVVKLLLNSGANVHLQDKYGYTAFNMASVIGDCETDLYRSIAALATHSPTQLSPSPVDGTSQQQKPGLKAWWGRFSDRFRNLKLGRTFALSSNRLSPAESKKTSMDDSHISTIHLTSPINLPRSTSIQELSSGSLMKTNAHGKLNHSSIAIGKVAVGATPHHDNNLFQRPPKFDQLAHIMPVAGKTSQVNKASSPMKLLSGKGGSSISLNNSQSPSSSGGATGISKTSQSQSTSSATSSTLTNIDSGLSSINSMYIPVNPYRGVQNQNLHKSSGSNSSFTSSKKSLSTLSSYVNSTDKNSSQHEDDVRKILQQLSLQQYRPIFEEQEVDMETFLTLQDTDLSELGITQKKPRQQILKAIKNINLEKHIHSAVKQ